MVDLSVDKHCELLTSHIRDRVSAIWNGFKIFIQMFSAIVAGTVVLRLEYGENIPSSFVWLSEALVGLVFLMATIIIIENIRSWYQLRKALSTIAGMDGSHKPVIPPPKLWRPFKIEMVMFAVMASALIGFIVYNPLLISN